jgi:hypothetical protein
MEEQMTQLDGIDTKASDTELLRAGLRALEMVESADVGVTAATPPAQASPADARLVWERAWIRVLVPFTFRLDTEKAETGFDWLGHAGQALKEADETKCQPWKPQVQHKPASSAELHVHADYTADYYSHVTKFLFGDSESSQTGCACWRIEPGQIARWLRNSSLIVVRGTGEKSIADVQQGWLDRQEHWPVRAIDDSGVELFLSQMGAGVLSVSLEVLPPVAAGPSEIAEGTAIPPVSVLGGLLHALATGQKAVWLCRHQFDGYRRDGENATLPLPALEDRLNDGVEPFSWSELVAWLLQPLTDSGLEYQAESRNMANVAILVPQSCSLEEAVNRGRALSELSQLSQLHTTTHPGEMAGESHSVPLVINRTHVASMSLSGVAHGVAREIPGDGAVNPYDVTHLRRAHFEYFVAWLLAVIQRLALRQSIERGVRLVQLRRHVACKIDRLERERMLLKLKRKEVQEQGGAFRQALQGLLPSGSVLEVDQRLRQVRKDKEPVRAELQRLERHWSSLRSQFLDFSLQGEFVQVSPRSTVQHFYDKAQEATQVPAALTKIRNAMADWDNAQRAEEAAGVARKATGSIRAIKRMQGNLEWVEIFILGACLVEVVHYLGEHGGVVAGALLILGFAGLYAAIRIFRPESRTTLNRRTVPAIVLLVAVSILSGLSLWWEASNKEKKKDDNGGNESTVVSPASDAHK